MRYGPLTGQLTVGFEQLGKPHQPGSNHSPAGPGDVLEEKGEDCVYAFCAFVFAFLGDFSRALARFDTYVTTLPTEGHRYRMNAWICSQHLAGLAWSSMCGPGMRMIFRLGAIVAISEAQRAGTRRSRVAWSSSPVPSIPGSRRRFMMAWQYHIQSHGRKKITDEWQKCETSPGLASSYGVVPGRRPDV